MTFKFDKSWTLFLDRDGVINKRIPGGYVKDPGQFEFIEGVPEAIAKLSEMFGLIVVVTNQQGIGKGLMTSQDLENVHNYMIQGIIQAGGRIDGIYFSPYLEREHHCTRKPGVGMGLRAKKDFRQINFKKSVMAGDSFSDLLFGKRLKMKTVYINQEDGLKINDKLTDFVFPDLRTFALEIFQNSTVG